MDRRADSEQPAHQSRAPLVLEAMRFRGEWRDYQARVLDEMDEHLSDGRLHVVAAPGSGKTILGLEATRRLGRPVIALSPTLVIRNQWRDRLCPLFLPEIEPWRKAISTDLCEPAELTIATYQALHAAWKSADQPFGALAALGPVTIILDECHHLRREWWNALFALREALADISIVALTATPPYDAAFSEWRRYEDLCGPIDAEIGVPELVRNGELAPHQDHIHFSTPSRSLMDSLLKRREAVFALMDEVASDAGFHVAIAAHPFLTDPASHEAAILERPEALSAMMVLLNHAGHALPGEVVELMGANPDYVPPFTQDWFQPLLEVVLNCKVQGWALDADRRSRWLARLGEGGLVQNKRVHFSESLQLARQLSGSTAKLDSAVEILRAEHASLGDDLRMAVLTDHVRAAEMPRTASTNYSPQRLGVVPLFEALRKSGVEQRLGVLSGSLVIIPASARHAALEAAERLGIASASIQLQPCGHDPAYLHVALSGTGSAMRVALVTQLVASGHVRVVVGTQALLGEGWDAPSINSLVLASNAGSFMLSNQMRGRAIRTDPAKPEKVANIWHLATIDPYALDGEGPDMALMQRRFAMFDGVAKGGEMLIENGLDRLGLRLDLKPADRNALTLSHAADRAATASHWRASLGKGTARSQVRAVAETRSSNISSDFQFRSTLKAASISAMGSGFLAAGFAIRAIDGLGFALIALGGFTLLYSAPGLLNAARLFIRNGTLEKQLKQVGMVVLEGLDHVGQLSAPLKTYQVRVLPALKGNSAITIEGGTRADQNRFVEALMELLGPVQNPRYLLRRYGRTLGFVQEDFHGVPALIGTKASHAAYFCNRWQLRIGSARVDFTRSANGRRMLLKARARSLAAGLRHPLARRSMWL